MADLTTWDYLEKSSIPADSLEAVLYRALINAEAEGRTTANTADALLALYGQTRSDGSFSMSGGRTFTEAGQMQEGELARVSIERIRNFAEKLSTSNGGHEPRKRKISVSAPVVANEFTPELQEWVKDAIDFSISGDDIPRDIHMLDALAPDSDSCSASKIINDCGLHVMRYQALIGDHHQERIAPVRKSIRDFVEGNISRGAAPRSLD